MRYDVTAAGASRAGLAYFALVFGAGFVLGAIRVPFVVPHIGERAAELAEMPIMLAVVVVAARFIARRFELPAAAAPRLIVGGLALALLLLCEVLLVVVFQRVTLSEYIAGRDPVSGVVYVAMLLTFAAMPLLLLLIERRFPSLASVPTSKPVAGDRP